MEIRLMFLCIDLIFLDKKMKILQDGKKEISF